MTTASFAVRREPTYGGSPLRSDLALSALAAIRSPFLAAICSVRLPAIRFFPMDPDEESLYDEGAAAVAHSRWPTIGLFTGAGVGFALGILFVAQWFLTVLYIIVCGCVGCLCGYFAASIIYRKQN